jgi:molecular chaperone GrpE
MPSSPASEGGEERREDARTVTSESSPEQREQQAPPAPTEQADHAAELARMEDRYKRAVADLDNYRKRAAQDVDRRVADVRESLLRDWLDAVDSVERALRMNPESPLFEGLRSVLEQMESILTRQGVQRIGQAGEPFDPERHEAVSVRVTDDVPDQTVVEVVRSGFAIGDRVLRPAQVIVARHQERAP